MLFLIYSVLGWLVETIYCWIRDKKICDRGFLIGPCCPVYGISALAMTIILSKYHNDILLLFIMSFVISSVVEYIVSFLLEKIFSARWWDYSKKSFNVNGRINLENSIYFGFLGILVIRVLNPFIISRLSYINTLSLYIISIIFLLIFIADIATSVIITFKLNKTADMIKRDCSLEFNTKIREILTEKSILFKRINLAFPNYNIISKKLKISKK